MAVAVAAETLAIENVRRLTPFDMLKPPHFDALAETSPLLNRRPMSGAYETAHDQGSQWTKTTRRNRRVR